MKKTFLRFVSTVLATLMLFGSVNLGVFAVDIAEKQNTVTVTTQAPSVTTQEKDGVDAGVSVKAITRNKTIASIIAGSKLTLTPEEKAVLNATALKSEVLTYTEPGAGADEFVTLDITDVANTYTVSAESIDSGLTNKWVPVGGRAVCAGGDVVFALENGEGTFTAEAIDHVEITYALVVSEISPDTADFTVKLPATLADEAVAQKDILDYYAKDSVYAALCDFATYIPLLDVFKESFGVEAQGAITKLIGECIYEDGDGKHLYFAEYIGQYRTKGLAYYYAEGNYENFKAQLEAIRDALNVLCADPKFDQIFEAVASLKPELADKKDNILAIKDDLNNKALVPVNANIDRTSAYLSGLAEAVENAIGNCGTYAVSEITLEKIVSVVAPDKTTIDITVAVADKEGGITDSVTESVTFDLNTVLTGYDILDLETLIMDMEADLGIDPETYARESIGDALPEAGDTLSSRLSVSFVWAPVSYVIVVAGNEQVLYADGSGLSIILPGSGTPDERYVYTIGDEEVPVGAENKEYTFADISVVKELCGAEGTYVVTRAVINAAREKILSFVDAMNKAMISKASVEVGGDKVPVVSFIPVEDANGNISIIFRVTPYLQGVDYQALIMDVMQVLTVSGNPYRKLSLNGETLYDGKIYLQTLLNTVFSDGVGFDAICEMIDANGQIADLKTTEAGFANINVIETEVPVAMTGNLGGKLILAELGADTNTYPLYITFEDYDQMSDRLLAVEGAIETVKTYINVTANEGSLDIEFTMPARFVAFYYAQALALEHADLSDIENMELHETIDFLMSIIKPLIADPDLTLDTLENTLDKVGNRPNLTSKITEDDFSMIRRALNYLLTKGDVECDAYGNYYGVTATYEIRELLASRFNIDPLFLSAVAEAGEGSKGIAFTFSVTDNTAEKHDFDALVINPSAGIKDIIKTTADLASALKNASENTVVILLRDVTLSSDVVIPARTFINLNGFTITGNMTTSAAVRITDSNLKGCGGVDGTLSGNFVLTGGCYTGDVASMLKAGYVLGADGCVTNAIFTVSEDDLGNITVAISEDFLNADNLPASRSDLLDLVADIAFDIALNTFTSASVSVGGNDIYTVEMNDVLASLSGSMSDLLDMIGLEGISVFATDLLQALTDFEAVANAVETGDAILTTDITTRGWDITTEIVGETDKYITLNLVPSTENIKSSSLTIVVAPNATENEKAALVDLFENLANTVTFSEISFAINSIDFDGTTPVVDMTGVVDVDVDFSEDARYAAIIVAAAAYASEGKRDAFVEAINEYFDGSLEGLVTALDSITSAEVISAMKVLGTTTCEEMLAELGIENSTLVDLESVYADLLNIAGEIVSALGVNGDSTTLAACKEDGTMATYAFSRENVKGIDVSFSLVALTEDTPVKALVSDPAIDTTNKELVAGALVINGVVYIDANCAGITEDQLLDLITVETKHVRDLRITVVKGAEAASSSLVCTGDILKISANGGDLVVRYNIVVLGDTNCNGKNDAGDAVRMASHYVGKEMMDAFAYLASDVNVNKELDAGDAVKVTGKFMYWNNYTSNLD